MNLKNIMSSSVVSVTKYNTLYDCAFKMYKYDIGFLVVLNEDQSAYGVITDRDILLSLVCGHNLETKAFEIANTTVISVKANMDITEASTLMGYYQIKRLVVIDDEFRVCGVISIRDIALCNEFEDYALDTLQEISYGCNINKYIIEYDNFILSK